MPFLPPNQQCQSTEGTQLTQVVPEKGPLNGCVLLRNTADASLVISVFTEDWFTSLISAFSDFSETDVVKQVF